VLRQEQAIGQRAVNEIGSQYSLIQSSIWDRCLDRATHENGSLDVIFTRTINGFADVLHGASGRAKTERPRVRDADLSDSEICERCGPDGITRKLRADPLMSSHPSYIVRVRAPSPDLLIQRIRIVTPATTHNRAAKFLAKGLMLSVLQGQLM
jgi:hypothetical protein